MHKLGTMTRAHSGLDDLATTLDALPTEAGSEASAGYELLSTRELVRRMNAEDAGVPDAIAAVADRVSAAIDAVSDRLLRGGRLIYVGDTGDKYGYFDVQSLKTLGVVLDNHGKRADWLDDAADLGARADVDPGAHLGARTDERMRVDQVQRGRRVRHDERQSETDRWGQTQRAPRNSGRPSG